MVTGLQAAAIVVGLVAAGVDADAVFARAGIPLADLADPERRFPREGMLTLWRTAREATGDPAFGLHVAERITPGAFDILEYIARSSSTLGDALARVARYVRLLDDVAEIAFVTTGDEITLVPSLSDAWPIPSDVMEGLLAMTIRLARELCGDPTPCRARSKCGTPRRSTRGSTRGSSACPCASARRRTGSPSPGLSSPSPSCTPIPRSRRSSIGTHRSSSVASRRRGRSASACAGSLRPSFAAATRRSSASPGSSASARTLRRRLQDEGTSSDGAPGRAPARARPPLPRRARDDPRRDRLRARVRGRAGVSTGVQEVDGARAAGREGSLSARSVMRWRRPPGPGVHAAQLARTGTAAR